MTTAQYAFGTTLRNLTFEDAVRRVTDALDAEASAVADEADARLRRVIDGLWGEREVS